MPRRNPPAKWVLPDVVHPPDSICITIPVPNNRLYIGAFWGALYNLSSARFWQDDTAHTALLVAKVWQDIIDDLKPDMCNVPDETFMEEWEDIMSVCQSLRFHEGKLQGLCCGEWVDIDGQEGVTIGGPGQEGGGAPQPEDGGGCQTYHAQFQAGSQYYLPTVVSSGDTLEFSNAKGSGYDGALLGPWSCPNGQTFFAGLCIGVPAPVSGDPSPLPHMELIININGTWYPADTGTLTVPGGVSNAPAYIQVNDGVIAGNSGGYSLDIKVCNNTPSQWTHTLNLATAQPLTILNDPSYAPVPLGTWVASEGYHTALVTTNATGNHYQYLEAFMQFSANTTLTSFQIKFDEAPGSNTASGNLGNYLLWRNNAGANAILISSTPSTATDVLLTWTGSQVAHGISVQIWMGDNLPGDGDPHGHARLFQMTVSGTGFDPFV